MRKWIREHPKIIAAVGLAATAAAGYYGVPPELSGPFLEGLCKGLTLCP